MKGPWDGSETDGADPDFKFQNRNMHNQKNKPRFSAQLQHGDRLSMQVNGSMCLSVKIKSQYNHSNMI